MKRKFKIFLATFFLATFFLQSACSKKDAKTTSAAEPPASPEVETFDEKNFPEATMRKGYTHPYRWNTPEGEKVRFKEIWGYVLADRVNDWNREAALTDIGLFAVEVDIYGNLTRAPSRSLIKNFNGRVHLVAVCQSQSLTHFVLDARFGKRDRLVNALIAASKDFDGLQIDYELVPKLDGEDFAEFLRLLKKGLGSKQLTVCVHARTKKLKSDVEDYERLANICDKVMIMAYDEHWATSAPGSPASMEWCRRVGEYALSILPPEKYIIGVPFYGRSWEITNDRTAGAWAFNGSSRRLIENGVEQLKRENGVPYFEFEKTVKVIQYFEDATSLLQRCRMYQSQGFSNIAFWRMGQEDVAFWDWIETDK